MPATRKLSIRRSDSLQQQDLIRLVAHDLRTPLSAIRVAMHLLAGRSGNDKLLTQYADVIRRAVDDLDQMAGRLLDLSSDEPPQAHCCSVADVVTELMNEYRAIAELNGITLEVALPSTVCWAAMDPASMRHVLSNLLGNALRFTQHGRIGVQAEGNALEIRLTVTDSGSGIPAEDLPHVFDPSWYQRRNAGTRAGLGLSLVKKIVEAHGGTIAISSWPGLGTACTVVVPAVPECPNTAIAVGDGRWRADIQCDDRHELRWGLPLPAAMSS